MGAIIKLESINAASRMVVKVSENNDFLKKTWRVFVLSMDPVANVG